MGLVFIASATASGSATLEFTSGIDSTYNEYQFYFVNLHPQTQHVHPQFQVNVAGASGFNETITSTHFVAYANEGDSDTTLAYSSSHDQGQGTAYQNLFYNLDYENDDSCSGILTLYNPSSTTYVKHFVSTMQGNHHTSAYSMVSHVAGYINVTAAIDEISFKMDTGNIDAGTIHMYGVG